MQATIHVDECLRARGRTQQLRRRRALAADRSDGSQSDDWRAGARTRCLVVRAVDAQPKTHGEGARFYRDCVADLQKLHASNPALSRRSAAPGGSLKVGMAPGLRRRVLMRAIPVFQQKYPDIELCCSVSMTAPRSAKRASMFSSARAACVITAASARSAGPGRAQTVSIALRRCAARPISVAPACPARPPIWSGMPASRM